MIRAHYDSESGCFAVEVLIDLDWLEVFQMCTEDEADKSISTLLEWKSNATK